MHYRFKHVGLVFTIIMFVVLAFTYSLLIPLGEAVDEIDHYNYIAFIGAYSRLPVLAPPLEQNITYEAHQPPLYYLLNLALVGEPVIITDELLPVNPCFSWNPEDIQRHNLFIHSAQERTFERTEFVSFRIVRWFSILMGIATIVSAYSMAYVVSASNIHLSVLTAAILAFNPQYIYLTSSINNDVLTVLLGTMVTLVSLLVIKREDRTRYCILLGLLVGLSLLTKLSLLVFWPLALVAAGIAGLKKLKHNTGDRTYILSTFVKASYWAIVPCLLVVIFFPVVVAGWWYLRSYFLYGDPLAWQVLLNTWGDNIVRSTPFNLIDLLQFILLHFESYWFRFGWLSFPQPSWIYLILAMFIGLSFAGFVTNRSTLRHLRNPAWIIVILPICFTYIALLVYLQDINWVGYQGRHAYGAAASIALLLATGFLSLPFPKIGYIFAITLFILAILAIPLTFWPSYYGGNGDIPLETDMCGRFDNGLQVDSVQVEGKIAPGEIISIHVQGYGLSTIYEPQTMLVRILDKDGREVGVTSVPIKWVLSEKVDTQLEFHLPRSVKPGPAKVEVKMLSENGLAVPSIDVRLREMPTPSIKLFIQQEE